MKKATALILALSFIVVLRQQGRCDQQDRLKMGDRKIHAGSGHDPGTL